MEFYKRMKIDIRWMADTSGRAASVLSHVIYRILQTLHKKNLSNSFWTLELQNKVASPRTPQTCDSEPKAAFSAHLRALIMCSIIVNLFFCISVWMGNIWGKGLKHGGKKNVFQFTCVGVDDFLNVGLRLFCLCVSMLTSLCNFLAFSDLHMQQVMFTR